MKPARRAKKNESSEPTARRTPEERRAEVERVAREHGADLSEEGFNAVLKKVAAPK
jgi:hypothetical protein